MPLKPQSQLPTRHTQQSALKPPGAKNCLDLLKKTGKSKFKVMAVFFFIAHEKGFTFHAQPQNGAYSSSC